MSDTSMESGAKPITVHTVRTPATKIAKPDLYYGDRSKLEEWLL
jgi:hypothetical protein